MSSSWNDVWLSLTGAFFKAAREYNPVVLTGSLVHSLRWLVTSGGDWVYENTNFNPKDEEGVAVYCVHGTADRVHAFSQIANRLMLGQHLVDGNIAQGEVLSDRIQSIHLLSFDKRGQGLGIDEFAEQLKAKIQANGHKRVILMGHSRGGDVAAHFAQYMARDADIDVEMLITIGTPFGGSYLAATPGVSQYSKSVKQMQKESEYLEALSESIARDPVCPYYFFAVKRDGVVEAKCSYVADYVKEHDESLITLDKHCHLTVLSSWRLLDYIRGIFKEHLLTKQISTLDSRLESHPVESPEPSIFEEQAAYTEVPLDECDNDSVNHDEQRFGLF